MPAGQPALSRDLRTALAAPAASGIHIFSNQPPAKAIVVVSGFIVKPSQQEAIGRPLNANSHKVQSHQLSCLLA